MVWAKVFQCGPFLNEPMSEKATLETTTFIQADVGGSGHAGVSLHVGLTGHEVD